MQKQYLIFVTILIFLSCAPSFCMDDNPVRFKPKTHRFGREIVNSISDEGIWAILPSLSREKLTQQLKSDALKLDKSINKKFHIIQPIQPSKKIDAEIVDPLIKILDATISHIYEKNPHPSTTAAMVMWTCRNWGKRCQGTPDKVIIKADHDADAPRRWIIGITYMLEQAEKNKHHVVSECEQIVALTLKKHHDDPLVIQLPKELLTRLAQFEPIEKEAPDRVDISKTQISGVKNPKISYFDALQNMIPGQIDFSDPSERWRKKNKQKW